MTLVAWPACAEPGWGTYLTVRRYTKCSRANTLIDRSSRPRSLRTFFNCSICNPFPSGPPVRVEQGANGPVTIGRNWGQIKTLQQAN